MGKGVEGVGYECTERGDGKGDGQEDAGGCMDEGSESKEERRGMGLGGVCMTGMRQLASCFTCDTQILINPW